MRRPPAIAGDPDAYRFRFQRRGGRSLGGFVAALAAPRAFTLGAQIVLSGGAEGAGGQYAGSPDTNTDIGIPTTGVRKKIVGYYRVGSTDVIG
jgi:hypothetical protein